MQNRKYDLEDRFVDYTCRMIDVVEALPNTRAGNYIASQLIKSCHSKKELIKPSTKLGGIFKETEELIAIIAKGITTAKKNEYQKLTKRDVQ